MHAWLDDRPGSSVCGWGAGRRLAARKISGFGKTSFMNPRCFLLCLACMAALAGCQPQPASTASVVRIEGPTMGSTYHISYVPGPGGQPAAAQAQGAVQALLGEIDAAVSTYRDDSDLARFNAAPAPVCMDMPDTALELARHALALAQQSEGAFDVTLLPVLEAWGFRHGAAARSAHEASPAPAPAELEAARDRMGMQHLRVQPGQLCKDAPIRVEFNSIAAGYAVDRVASYFAQQGVGSYLVEITGEMKAVGLKPDGAPWRIAIEAPLEGERQAQRIAIASGAWCSVARNLAQALMRLHHLRQRTERGAHQHELVIRRKARGRLRRKVEQGNGAFAVARQPGAEEIFGNACGIVALR